MTALTRSEIESLKQVVDGATDLPWTADGTVGPQTGTVEIYGWRVKELDWDGPIAVTPFCSYSVGDYGDEVERWQWVRSEDPFGEWSEGTYASEAESKAGAQADYEQRITSALSAIPQPEAPSSAGMVKALTKARDDLLKLSCVTHKQMDVNGATQTIDLRLVNIANDIDAALASGTGGAQGSGTGAALFGGSRKILQPSHRLLKGR